MLDPTRSVAAALNRREPEAHAARPKIIVRAMRGCLNLANRAISVVRDIPVEAMIAGGVAVISVVVRRIFSVITNPDVQRRYYPVFNYGFIAGAGTLRFRGI